MKGGFLKNILILGSGTGVAQLLIVISSPLLTRLYDGEAYGTYGAFISLGVILSGIVTLRYEFAVVLVKDIRDSIEIARVSFFFNILLSLIVLILSLIFAEGLVNLFNLQLHPGVLFLVVFYPFLSGFYNVYNFLLVKSGSYKKVSSVQIVKSVVVVATQLCLGYLLSNYFGLLAGQLLGLLASVVLSVFLFGEHRQVFSTRWSRVRACYFMRKFSSFPKYNMPQNFVNSVSQNVPTLLLTGLYSPEIAGFYWFTVRILQMPITVIGQAVRKVFFKSASDLFNAGKPFRKLYFKASASLLALGAVPALGLFLFGDSLFSLVFGDEWRTAGEYSRYLIWFLAVALANAPSMMTFQILQKQSLLLVFEVVLLLARLGAIYVGKHFGSSLLSIQLFSAVGLIFNLFLIVWGGYKLMRHEGK